MIKRIAEKLNLSEDITKILVGFCGFILFIIITGTISSIIFHSKDTQQTTPQPQKTEIQKSKWERIDNEIFKDVVGIVAESGGEEIIESIKYERKGESSIRYVFNIKTDAGFLPDTVYKNFVRGVCIGIANKYKKDQWVEVQARLKGITIAEAEYSPFTDKVVVK